MKKNLLTFIILFLFSVVEAQNVLNISGEDITLEEFKNIFYKNKHDVGITEKYLDEYMNLFINFKLKVKEAESLGLDTLPSFIKELNGYKKQLSAPYLNDKEFNERMVFETYERMKYDINASHILFAIDEKSSSEDALMVLERAVAIRDRIIRGHISFEDAAVKYSADKSASFNKGNLGFFTVFMMVYPFETAAYNTLVGDISQPIRTKYGYHLVRVNNKRNAVGEVQVAHIMCKTGKAANQERINEARKKINRVWSLLNSGEDFATVAEEYSEDRTTAVKGGLLPRFGVGKMVKEFEDLAFSLNEIGDFSEPFETDFGFHVIALIDKQGIPLFDEVKSDIKRKVLSDSRGQLSREALIKRLKNDYKIKEYKSSTGVTRLEQIKRYGDDFVKEGNWDGENARGLIYNLFKIESIVISQNEFIDYILLNQSKGGNSIGQLYDIFMNEKLVEYEESNLSNKYPEYKTLLKEYRDGILLFDLTNKKVWGKAVQDTLGLRNFYDRFRENYMWGERIEATIYICSDLATTRKVKSLVRRKNKANSAISLDNFLKEKVEIQSGKFSRGVNKYIDQVDWKLGVSKDIKEGNGFVFIHIKAKLPSEIKLLEETKGKVISDYQDMLDKDWIKELRSKYRFIVNKEILYSILK